MGTSSASSPAPLCFLCARYRDSYRCEAYPEGIPFDIIASDEDHRHALEGDHGLQFLPVTDVAARYAEELFAAATPESEADAEAIASRHRILGARRIPA